MPSRSRRFGAACVLVMRSIAASHEASSARNSCKRRLARGCQLNRFRAAFEQLDAQRTFQLADLPRQRRLRDVQAFGGATEAQLFRHGDEVAQLAQVDRPVHAEKVLHKSQFPQTGLLRRVRAANKRLRRRRLR